MQAIIEVWDEAEEQAFATEGALEIRWLHRKAYPARATGMLADAAKLAIETIEVDTFVWIACEKEDVQIIHAFLKDRRHDRKRLCAAWYWERNPQ
jgi:NADPH-dependent ferric siderophore reductase